jgi:hypothetical protein
MVSVLKKLLLQCGGLRRSVFYHTAVTVGSSVGTPPGVSRCKFRVFTVIRFLRPANSSF